MPFSASIKESALRNSRYCCCICNEFAGLDTNVQHIIQEEKGGSNNLVNAVVLCNRCYQEVELFNEQSSTDRTYSPYRLKKHRDAWWQWCALNPRVVLPIDPFAQTAQPKTKG